MIRRPRSSHETAGVPLPRRVPTFWLFLRPEDKALVKALARVKGNYLEAVQWLIIRYGPKQQEFLRALRAAVAQDARPKCPRCGYARALKWFTGGAQLRTPENPLGLGACTVCDKRGLRLFWVQRRNGVKRGKLTIRGRRKVQMPIMVQARDSRMKEALDALGYQGVSATVQDLCDLHRAAARQERTAFMREPNTQLDLFLEMPAAVPRWLE